MLVAEVFLEPGDHLLVLRVLPARIVRRCPGEDGHEQQRLSLRRMRPKRPSAYAGARHLDAQRERSERLVLRNHQVAVHAAIVDGRETDGIMVVVLLGLLLDQLAPGVQRDLRALLNGLRPEGIEIGRDLADLGDSLGFKGDRLLEVFAKVRLDARNRDRQTQESRFGERAFELHQGIRGQRRLGRGDRLGSEIIERHLHGKSIDEVGDVARARTERDRELDLIPTLADGVPPSLRLNLGPNRHTRIAGELVRFPAETLLTTTVASETVDGLRIRRQPQVIVALERLEDLVELCGVAKRRPTAARTEAMHERIERLSFSHRPLDVLDGLFRAERTAPVVHAIADVPESVRLTTFSDTGPLAL